MIENEIVIYNGYACICDMVKSQPECGKRESEREWRISVAWHAVCFNAWIATVSLNKSFGVWEQIVSQHRQMCRNCCFSIGVCVCVLAMRFVIFNEIYIPLNRLFLSNKWLYIDSSREWFSLLSMYILLECT